MRLLLTSLILLIFTTESFSQWSSDITQNNPVVTAPRNQFEPISISDGIGGVIVIWEDQRNTVSATERDIYAQRFDSLGYKQWGESNGLPVAVLPMSERFYDICSDGKGGAFIVWEEYSENFVITRIRGQRVRFDGVKMWGDSGVYITNEGNKQLRPKITVDNFGGFFLAYETSELNSSEVELKANRLDSNGTKLWGNGIFFCTAPTNQSEIVVTTSSDNMLLVTWRDFRNILTESDIYIQKINQSGNVLWQNNGIAVCNERFEHNYQDVYLDNSGGAFVVWCDKRDSIQFDIFAQRVRSDGSRVAPLNGVPVCLAPTNQFRPRFTTDMQGGVIVTWNDFRNGPSAPFNIDIYAQRIDSLCNMLWTADGVQVCDAPLSQNNQRITSDGNFGAVITWDDRRAGTSTYDIYAQRVDSAGNLVWDIDDVAISIATGNQYKPYISPVSGGYAIVFEDARNGFSDYNIYIQKVLQSGSVILNIGNINEIVSGYELFQNFPNPFNPSTTIRFKIENSNEKTTLRVYNILGERVAELINDKLNSGFYEVKFDAVNLSSGVYYYNFTSGNFSESKKMILLK